MSAALKKELTEVTSCTPKRNEEEQDYLGRLVSAIANLDDADWDSLSSEAQDWYNDAAEAANKGKPIKGFIEDEEPAKPSRGSRAAKKEEPQDSVKEEEEDIKVGDKVIAVTKRGKEITGKVVEIEGETLIIETEDGDEEEVDTTKLKSLAVQQEEKPKSGRGSRDAKKEEPDDDPEDAADDIQVGDKVTATTKRGKEITGEVVEIDDDVVVIEDAEGEEHELDRAKLAELVKQEEKPSRKARGSRAAKEEASEKPARAPKVSKEDNGGVSVTTRIRELILDDIDAELPDIEKTLKKEKLAYKEATLKLIYGEVHRLLDMLKERKLLKVAR